MYSETDAETNEIKEDTENRMEIYNFHEFRERKTHIAF